MGKKNDKNHKWLIIKSGGSLLIRFKYQNRLYQLAPVVGGRFDNPQDVAIANKVAGEIEMTIKLGKFENLAQWKPERLEDKTGIGNANPYSLGDIWRDYKVAKGEKVSPASQRTQWLQTDRCLQALKSHPLGIFELMVSETKVSLLVSLLLQQFSPHVVRRILQDLHAACSLALKRKLITINPLTGYKDELPDTTKGIRSKECYSHDEALLIIEAFRGKYSKIAVLVEFLFLTGVRPQLAIALTWGDVQADKIIFNKGYTKGVITEGKTGRVTHYPKYPQLKELMERISFDADCTLDNCLVFPSATGIHIDLHNFTNRIWKPVIKSLVQSGKLAKYLPTYNCRHSAATFLAKAGLASSTIAALLDTSEQMLNKHYFDNRELTNVVIPDLLVR